ncbi:hypothetical protein D3C85_1310360 [compost metagenome]
MAIGTRKVSNRNSASGATSAIAFSCLLRRSRASLTFRDSPSAAVSGAFMVIVSDMGKHLMSAARSGPGRMAADNGSRPPPRPGLAATVSGCQDSD